jgi:hypothetical protein
MNKQATANNQGRFNASDMMAGGESLRFAMTILTAHGARSGGR